MNNNKIEDKEIIQSLKRADTISTKSKILRWVPSIIILPICIYWVVNYRNYGLIDNVDLVIHEAGHIFFSLFGKFIYTLGGTLMQLIIPFIIAAYFFRNNYRTGVQFGLLWLGQNIINISVYAADARSQKLPLLNADVTIGYIFLGIAILIFLAAVLMPLITQD